MLLWASITFPHQECHNYAFLKTLESDVKLWGIKFKVYDELGESTLSPPKIVITSIIFLQLIFLVMYGHHILDYLCLFK